jgi:rhodanese-related sulfurtransferase
MAKTFNQMVEEAMTEVPVINAVEAHRRMEEHPVPEKWRNPEFQDRSRPIIMACQLGLLGPLAGKLLKDMGFTNVCYLEGGLEAWKEAGFSTAKTTT